MRFLNQILQKLFMCVFVEGASFALSVVIYYNYVKAKFKKIRIILEA